MLTLSTTKKDQKSKEKIVLFLQDLIDSISIILVVLVFGFLAII